MANFLSNGIILPHQDITLCYPDRFNSVVSPLYKFDIKFFCYMRVYPDGTVLDICNDPALQEYFYYKSEWYKKFSPFFSNANINSTFLLDKSFIDADWLNTEKQLFDIDYVMYYITKKQQYTEYWQFGTKSDNHNIINFYMQNTELLKAFMQYFLCEGRSLIDQADNNRYKILSINNEQNHNPLVNIPDDREVQLTINKLMKHIPENYSLSIKEIECLKLSAQGATAKEIAKGLNISYRTVEKHFENIRLKIGINKITSIIHKVHELGII